jgi:predicted nucleic acid-binding protein
MILADTSVWINHLHKTDAVFSQLLETMQIAIHPFVVGEIALGNLKLRKTQLAFMKHLPVVDVATDDEVLMLVERHTLFGTGLGYVDAHLLASALISSTSLWTNDKRLHQAAVKLGLSQSH